MSKRAVTLRRRRLGPHEIGNFETHLLECHLGESERQAHGHATEHARNHTHGRRSHAHAAIEHVHLLLLLLLEEGLLGVW